MGQVRPEGVGVTQNYLRLQERRWEKSTSTTCVVLSGINPKFVERRTPFRASAALVALAVT